MRRTILAVLSPLLLLAAGTVACAQPTEPDIPTLPVYSYTFDELTRPLAAAPPTATCDILDQIDHFRTEMALLSPSIGTTIYRYTEARAGKTKVYHEPETQIALGLLDPDTCSRRIITVTKQGNKLLAPSGYAITAVERINGIQWNYWNTLYRVDAPDDRFVAANVFPYEETRTTAQLVRTKTGKIVKRMVTTTTVVPVFYVPYTEELKRPEIIAAGVQYPQTVSQKVDEYLRTKGVRSLAYRDQLIVDVPYLKPEYADRKLVIEHMDETEFIYDPQGTTDRTYALIGANQDGFATYVCSGAKACGPRQFIAGTWRLMDQMFPAADLPSDFLQGARDPFYAAVAARLLDDYNLEQFKSNLSASQYAALIGDPKMLEEALASAYNTGSTRTLAVLKAYFAGPKKYADWIDAKGRGTKGHFITQTKLYDQKLRYIRDMWSAQTALRTARTPND